MIQPNAGNGINFYRGYRQRVNSSKNDRRRRRARLIVPMAALLAALMCVSAMVLLKNRQKANELAELQTQTAALSPEYDRALALDTQRGQVSARYELLALNQMLFCGYPKLNESLFTSVRDCAGSIFSISAYAYAETTRTLTLNASAKSVNEVPRFVERLRGTKLFESVQYTGYTSESEKTYFCTVGCTLTFSGEADGGVNEETSGADDGDATVVASSGTENGAAQD